MKKIIIITLALLLCVSFSACMGSSDRIGESSSVAENADGTSVETVAETSTETENWSLAMKRACDVHHYDYHMFPYDLVMCVGMDEVNAWLAECEKNADADAVCIYAECNIKTFIEKFDISREVFELNGDLVHFAAYDTELLYTGSDEEIEQYFSQVSTLRDESIKAQSYAFLENWFVNKYTSVVMSMLELDEDGVRSPEPSVPELVQAAGLSRSELESVIADMDAKTLQVCGKALRYDYDLDVIFEADGSYKKLPEFEGLTRVETVQKYERLFCRR